MTHESEHVIIHRIKEALTKPVPSAKRWHLVVIALVAFLVGIGVAV